MLLAALAGCITNAQGAAGLGLTVRQFQRVKERVKAEGAGGLPHRVLVPGDPERMAREERLRDGVAVAATTWGKILAGAEQVGLSRAELVAK